MRQGAESLLLEVKNMSTFIQFITGFLIGLYLQENPRLIVPALAFIATCYIYYLLYIYIKNGLIKL